MTGNYVYSPDMWPPLVTALFLVALGLYSWRRRAVPGALPLAIAWLMSALWMVILAAEVTATDPAAKNAWHLFGVLWQLPIAVAIACFALEYVYPGRWLTRRNLILLVLPVLLLSVFALTNDLHRLFWRTGIAAGPERQEFAIAGWIAVAYGMILALIQIVAFIWLFVRSPQHRWPVALMLAALLVTRGLLLLDLVRPDLAAWQNYSVLVIWLPASAYAVALFAFRIFDPLPVARTAALEQMQAGVVVFDIHARAAGLNSAAEKMLGIRSGSARGRTWPELGLPGSLPPTLSAAGSAISSAGSNGAGIHVMEVADITFGDGDRPRRYAATVSRLNDFRGFPVGHLLMLHDVTEERRAQAQIVEQQRALATLRERERLARDLHDSIGQVLGYAGFQVEAANQLIDQGEAHAARAQLTRLAGVLQAAHADVREYILNLRAGPSPQQPFFAAIRHYLDDFRSNYNVQVGLTVAAELDEARFSPEAQMQLFRILQEALSNARKHSRAQRIAVTFAVAEGRAVSYTHLTLPTNREV